MSHQATNSTSTEKFYEKIMKDVIESMRPLFINEGVSEQALSRLHTVRYRVVLTKKELGEKSPGKRCIWPPE